MEYNKWVKIIPDILPLLDTYSRKNMFKPVCDIILDNESKRNTLIKFEPLIPKDEYFRKSEWIYLICVNNKMVKIGGTRTGLKQRTNSYLCGHHTLERFKSGHCSNTNAFIYNTLYFYLKLDCEIKMYGYELPKTQIYTEILGEQVNFTAQTFNIYETKFLEDYKKIYSKYPCLNFNCDPEYK